MFYQWLLTQREREDDIGRFAILASADRKFPKRSHRLFMLLRYCGANEELRRAVKKAHSEWRQVRDVKAA